MTLINANKVNLKNPNKEFYNDNINDKDYNYFCEVFEEYFECGDDDFSNRHWLEIFLNSFNDLSRINISFNGKI